MSVARCCEAIQPSLICTVGQRFVKRLPIEEFCEPRNQLSDSGRRNIFERRFKLRPPLGIILVRRRLALKSSAQVAQQAPRVFPGCYSGLISAQRTVQLAWVEAVHVNKETALTASDGFRQGACFEMNPW